MRTASFLVGLAMCALAGAGADEGQLAQDISPPRQPSRKLRATGSLQAEPAAPEAVVGAAASESADAVDGEKPEAAATEGSVADEDAAGAGAAPGGPPAGASDRSAGQGLGLSGEPSGEAAAGGIAPEAEVMPSQAQPEAEVMPPQAQPEAPLPAAGAEEDAPSQATAETSQDVAGAEEDATAAAAGAPQEAAVSEEAASTAAADTGAPQEAAVSEEDATAAADTGAPGAGDGPAAQPKGSGAEASAALAPALALGADTGSGAGEAEEAAPGTAAGKAGQGAAAGTGGDSGLTALERESVAFQPSQLFSFSLGPGETQSLFEDIGADRAGWTVRGGYALAGPDAAGTATVQVLGSWGSVEWSGVRRQSGMWELRAGQGTYEIRATNHGRSAATLTLGWVVGGDSDNPLVASGDRGSGAAQAAGLAAGPRTTLAAMAGSAARIHLSLDTAAAELQSYSVVMRRNEMTGDDTHSRILWFNSAELCVVLVLALAQACIVRRLASTSLAVFSDPRLRTHMRGSRKFAPRGMV